MDESVKSFIEAALRLAAVKRHVGQLYDRVRKVAVEALERADLAPLPGDEPIPVQGGSVSARTRYSHRIDRARLKRLVKRDPEALASLLGCLDPAKVREAFPKLVTSEVVGVELVLTLDEQASVLAGPVLDQIDELLVEAATPQACAA